MDMNAPIPPAPAGPARDDEAAKRRRLRGFLMGLLALVALLILFAIGYVRLYDRFLADPGQPRNVKPAFNPRAFMVELLLLVGVASLLTAWIARKARRKP